MPMHIFINQTPYQLPPGATLSDALQAFGASGTFAVAINLQFVARAHYPDTTLSDGDHIEVIAPVTGG